MKKNPPALLRPSSRARFPSTRARISAVVLLMTAAGFAWPGRAAESSAPDRPAVKPHPRLWMDDARLAELKTAAGRDPLLQRYVRDALADADAQLGKPPLEHKIYDGLRMLAISRDALRRTTALAFAWRWTGEKKYADAAIANLRTVCAFPDWNAQRHFLDTAEMATAVAVGLDWLYPALDDAAREALRQGLRSHALTAKPGWWWKGPNNWNFVCNGGLIVAALAVADTDADLAQHILARSREGIPVAGANYAPDGAWMEGPGYWGYATEYAAFAIAALDSATGGDFGLSELRGFGKSGYFPIASTAPSGGLLNFADAGSFGHNRAKQDHTRKPIPCLFWLARKFGQTDFSDAEHTVLATKKASALHVVWYVPPTGKKPQRSLDRFFDGPVPVFLMRSAWDDPAAAWCGVKAGYNRVPHGHLDLGNFEFEAGGVRWAIDLGSDDYNLPGYFGKQRWDYYRLKSESHSVPLIDGRGQLADGTANVLAAKVGGATPSVTLDLTGAYADRAQKVVREISLTEGRRTLVVADRFRLAKPAAIVWAMTTDAEIEIAADGRKAVLTCRGRKLEAAVLSPENAVLSAESAEQKPPQADNLGFRRLLATCPAPAGETEVKIRLKEIP